MKYILNAAIALGLIAAVPAVAQTQSGTPHNQGSSASGQTSAQTDSASQGTITRKLQQDLQQSGFKNVRVMPESFLVRADDKDGHPVMMIVNPDSVTAVTQLSASGSSSASGASGSSPQASGGNTGAHGASGTSGSGGSTPSK